MPCNSKEIQVNTHIGVIATIIVVMLVTVFASFYSASTYTQIPAVSTLKVGDSFTYSVTGISTFQGPEAFVIPGFSQLNKTDYWKVTITAVSGSSVSYDSVLRYVNGTEIAGMANTVDLLSGQETAGMGFWVIYASNLTVGDPIHPTGSDRFIVNQTETKTYADTIRERNLWFEKYPLYDTNDLAHSKLDYGYSGLYFDKQTGVLETLNCTVSYSDPLHVETIIWKLVNTNVWNVQ